MAIPGLERAKGIRSGARLQHPNANPAADQTALELMLESNVCSHALDLLTCGRVLEPTFLLDQDKGGTAQETNETGRAAYPISTTATASGACTDSQICCRQARLRMTKALNSPLQSVTVRLQGDSGAVVYKLHRVLY